jgi:GNAT superfamily N-acetyltransferase
MRAPKFASLLPVFVIYIHNLITFLMYFIEMVYFKQIKLTTDSKPMLLRLQKLCLPYDKAYCSAGGVWWVGFEGDNAVAFCVVAPSKRWLDTAYLARAGVIASHRGKGLQKRMITLRERYAKRNKFKWVITDTTDNPPSSNSLIKRGYQLFDPSEPWGYSKTLYWRKKLI